MAKKPFGDIGAKKKAQNFIENAKVDGDKSKEIDPQGRRGSSYKDAKTGETIKLSGKILQVPLNEYELNILNKAAEQAELPLATFLRVTALKYAKNT